MRIERTLGIIGGSGLGPRSVSGRRVEPVAAAPSPDRDPAAARPEPGRALAPIAQPATPGDRLVRYRIDAPFLAQLIANRDGLPDTRRLRRAEPRRAAGLYAVAMDGPGLLVPGFFVDTAL